MQGQQEARRDTGIGKVQASSLYLCERAGRERSSTKLRKFRQQEAEVSVQRCGERCWFEGAGARQ